MKRATLLVLLLSALLTPHVQAAVMPTPFCLQPSYKKPLLFPSRHYVERHEREVKRYEECILEFIKEQEEAIAIHKEASKRAREQLNQFVKQ